MTMDNGNIRWDQPIEAVHEDGRVVAVKLRKDRVQPDGVGDYKLEDSPAGDANEWFNSEGVCRCNPKWTIRNVVEAKADEWGPEIKVEGKRPEWLQDKCVAAFNTGQPNKGDDGWYGLKGLSGGTVYYGYDYMDGDIGIRIPANHPHYAQSSPETHRQGTNGVRAGVEALERYEGLLRRLIETAPRTTAQDAIWEEARALLPEPVDPDLAFAKEIMEARYYINDPEWQGDLDTTRAFKLLKRGRALERGEG